MKVSISLVALCAALSAASPLRNRAEVVVVTEVVTKTTWVDWQPSPTAKPKNFNKAGLHRVKSKSTTTTTPPPPPTTTTTPPPPPPTTSEAPAETPAPAPAPVFKEETKVEAPKVEVAAPAPTEVKQETTTAAPAEAGSDLQTAALYHHNIHRANHSVSALSWSTSLASSAAQIASTCVFKHVMDVDGGGYGQNLAMMGGSAISGNPSGADYAKAIGQSITNMWYNGEFAFYDFGSGGPNTGNFGAWGHLSQVLWKATTEVGCAVQACGPSTSVGSGSNAWYAVCNYKSQGNFNNAYVANVLPPTGKATVTV